MAQPVDFHGANTTLGAPSGNEHNVSARRVFRNGMCCVSCWELSPTELEELVANGGKLYLTVFSGHTQPPVFIGDEGGTRELIADLGGVWKK